MSSVPSVSNQPNNPYRLLQLSQLGGNNSAQNAASSPDLAQLPIEVNQEGTNPVPSALSPSNGQFIDAYA